MNLLNLFENTYIGNLEVNNHFIRSATYEGLAAELGFPTEKICSTYKALADGGVGTIITSYTYITDYEQPEIKQLGIYSDEAIDGYRDLTEIVHSCGSRIIMQLVHGSSLSQGYPERAKILGPSDMKHPISGLISAEMTKEDIRYVTVSFADAARRAKAAGFDGVQIHCAHGYLLAQFISPVFNHRTDEYGGSLENRFRIVGEVYRAIRDEVGKEYPVWIKMNSSDEEPDGLTVQEFLKMASWLSADGINAIEVSGEHWQRHKSKERAYYQDAAMSLAELTDTPVILTGGLRELSDLKPIYEKSKINLFGFARPFMKNPAFIKTLCDHL